MIILKPLWFNKHLKECNWTSLVILKAKSLFVTGLNVKLLGDLILIVFLGQLWQIKHEQNQAHPSCLVCNYGPLTADQHHCQSKNEQVKKFHKKGMQIAVAKWWVGVLGKWPPPNPPWDFANLKGSKHAIKVNTVLLTCWHFEWLNANLKHTPPPPPISHLTDVWLTYQNCHCH